MACTKKIGEIPSDALHARVSVAMREDDGTYGRIDRANAGRSLPEHGFDGDDGQHAESTRCRSRC